jgi:hypothetical protein
MKEELVNNKKIEEIDPADYRVVAEKKEKVKEETKPQVSPASDPIMDVKTFLSLRPEEGGLRNKPKSLLITAFTKMYSRRALPKSMWLKIITDEMSKRVE